MRTRYASGARSDWLGSPVFVPSSGLAEAAPRQWNGLGPEGNYRNLRPLGDLLVLLVLIETDHLGIVPVGRVAAVGRVAVADEVVEAA